MFFLAMYQKNGQPAEKILRYYLQARFIRPKVRPYKTRNYYAHVSYTHLAPDQRRTESTGNEAAREKEVAAAGVGDVYKRQHPSRSFGGPSLC